jgi:DNA repair exonuclease SbcCD ATPase subunit
VVELLQQLSKQVEAEGEKEEDLYETFVCWGKTIIESKTASNSAADTRVQTLETYIADLAAGKIELTSERADLEKEIKELTADIEMADAMREKENKDFLGAEEEMKKAIAALKSAIDVLGDATSDHKKGVLLATRQKLSGGIAAVVEEQSELKTAVKLSERFLAKADALFLKRVLLGDVPTVDWKKLNRKATFKMSYKARSFKIQEVLQKMHATFSTNLKEAQQKESDTKAAYDKLSKAKNGQLDATKDALTKMEKEKGAVGLSKQESQDEVDSLKTQMENDKKFIKETEEALASKKKEWKVRQDLRSGELAAISKAISILHNDDARDMFKRSFASQGLFLLQVQTASEQKAASNALAALQDAVQRSHDHRLLSLVAILADPTSAKTKFGPVLKAIDKMIAMLKSEENKDLETKNRCEADRMADTRKAILRSREIDEMTEIVMKLVADIAKLKAEIEGVEAEHKKVEEELKAATRIRDDEHAAWKVTDKDDKAAEETVLSARDVLENFYKETKLVLAQKGKAPGEAPPPPPPTWDASYGGKTGESMGIVALLEMVSEDIAKDRSAAKAEEEASQKEYDEFKADSEKQMKSLTDEKNEKEKIKGQKVTDKSDMEKSRGTKKGELDAVLKTIQAVNPNCEYFEVNYSTRLKARQIELDGLQKAKAQLLGGTFTEGPDPDREMKPGDAASASFLHIRRSA